MIVFVPGSNPQILPIFSSAVQVGGAPSAGGAIALPPFSGTNTIILTPLGQPGLPTTVFSLPSSSSSSSSSPTVSLAIAAPKAELPVMIKSEPDPDLSIVEMADQD